MMKKDMIKRLTAFICAAAMCASMTACAEKSEPMPAPPADVTAGTEKTDKQEKTTEKTDSFFGEDYDPLADDYDPYGGGGAATVTGGGAVTEAAEEDTGDDDTPAAPAAQPAQTNKQTEAPAAKPAKTNKQTEAPAQTQKQTAKQTEAQTEKHSGSDSSKAAPKDVELIISLPNGWNDGTADYTQLDGTVRNNGSDPVEGWTATITAGSSATVEQSWNCDIKIKNGVMTITPVDYNKNVSAGNEITFGFILKNPGKIDEKKSSLSCSMGTYSASGGGGSGNSGNSGSSGGGTPPPAPVSAKNVPKPTTDDWLYVKGNKIVDKNGKEVWITGVNWFGYNTGTNTFDGLWTCDLNTSLAQIADHGFNLLRVPISAELINNWASGSYPTANFNQATNSYLVGMNSLEIFDYVIGQCRANGMKIMIDIHSAKTDASGHMKNVWYEGNVTEKDYLAALAWMAGRYKNDDTIIAYDLKNEPHGKPNESPRAKWDNSKDPDNWKYVAEKAAKAVLDKNPNVLVMVEGIEIYPTDIKKNGDFSSTNSGDYYFNWWGGNLRGVKDNPVNLGKYNNKLVYSPHDYGPTVYEQPWFKGDYSYKSLYNDVWYDNWLYIHETKTAPLLIGEWGGFMRQPNLKWMTYMRQLIKEKKLHHTFWCFNANSGDTGGLVKDDFTTWDKEKYDFVKEVLWQEDGKFVGLDHEIPLGKNGKALGK